jgi:hypothetical protein
MVDLLASSSVHNFAVESKVLCFSYTDIALVDHIYCATVYDSSEEIPLCCDGSVFRIEDRDKTLIHVSKAVIAAFALEYRAIHAALSLALGLGVEVTHLVSRDHAAI